MEIKRYSFDPHGPYVLHSDYQKLEAHLRGTLEMALKGSEEAISAIAADNAAMRVELTALRQVASELREALDHAHHYMSGCGCKYGGESTSFDRVCEAIAKYDALEGKK